MGLLGAYVKCMPSVCHPYIRRAYTILGIFRQGEGWVDWRDLGGFYGFGKADRETAGELLLYG